MKDKVPTQWINRDLSWLSFNERVLQESEDPNNPVIERMRFLGIFSNNRDEFFRVRVANIKRVSDLPGNHKLSTDENPKTILDKILKVVLKQQIRFDKAYAKLLKELEKDEIYFLDEKQIEGDHVSFIKYFFASFNISSISFLTPP